MAESDSNVGVELDTQILDYKEYREEVVNSQTFVAYTANGTLCVSQTYVELEWKKLCYLCYYQVEENLTDKYVVEHISRTSLANQWYNCSVCSAMFNQLFVKPNQITAF